MTSKLRTPDFLGCFKKVLKLIDSYNVIELLKVSFTFKI